MQRKERIALQRARIIALRAKDPSLTTPQLAARLGVARDTVARILLQEATGMRRKHDGTLVPVTKHAEGT